MYKNDIKYVAGHKGGYVSEDEVGSIGTHENTVIDCNNIDFREGYDERRNPYNTLTVTGLSLPSGYVIHNFVKKEFIDYQGNSQQIYVIVATKTGSRTRIYMSGYYCPDGAQNDYGETVHGFNSDWIEVTEYYKTGFESYTFTWTNDAPTKLKTTAAGLIAKQQDYFKGFFVFNHDLTTNNIIGIVSASQTVTGTLEITCDLETGTALGTGASTIKAGICRFPVNFFNKDIWDDITDVTISDEIANVLRFACGDDSRTLWLGMIKDRKWFDKSFKIGTIDHTGTHLADAWLTSVTGIYRKEYEADYEIKCSAAPTNYTTLQYRIDGGDWINLSNEANPAGTYLDTVLASGINARIEGGFTVNINTTNKLATDDVATFSITANTDFGVTWDGFWFGYDIPLVNNKKLFTFKNSDADEGDITKDDIGYELGISYDTDQYYYAFVEYDRVYSLCLELDGFQTIFVRQILSNDQRDQLIHGTLQKWFDRRITASLLFFDEMMDVNPATMVDSILPPSYLCDDNVPGYQVISKFGAVMKNQAGDDINGYRFPITLVNGIANGEATNISKMKKYATGLSLNSYLNAEYYKNVTTKAAKLIKVGESLVAVKISQDIVQTDLEDASSTSQIGKFSICIGNVQNAGVNTHSVMCSERIFERTREEIITAVETEPEQFLVFTDEKCYWNEILDAQAGTLKNIGTFLNRGAVSAKAVVRAIFTDKAPLGTADYKYSASQFSGVFFASYDSIYGFFNNEPVDLLYGRWRKTYRALSTATKQGIVGGYYPNRKEVWFNINNVIYVFSLERKHWKKYTLVAGDTQSNIYYDEQGQIIWHNNSLFFRLAADWEDRITGNTYKDKGTTPIPFYLKKKLNHGNVDMLKIPHRLSMFYEILTTEIDSPVENATIQFDSEGLTGVESEPFDLNTEEIDGGGHNSGKILLKVSSAEHTNDIYNDTIELVDKITFRQGYKIRKMCDYYTVELLTDEALANTTWQNIIYFKINQLSLKAKLTAGTLSKG